MKWSCFFLLFLGVCSSVPQDHLKNIIVIYLENWSFDSLFGNFPGANNLEKISQFYPQLNSTGYPYQYLPGYNAANVVVVPPNTIPNNGTFFLDPYMSQENPVSVDITHRFYQQQYQVGNGTLDYFVSWSTGKALAMSTFDLSDEYFGRLAKNFTLLDNFFHSTFGGSFLNHMWLISGQTPYWPQAPASTFAQLDNVTGILIKDGTMTPDGYAVNTIYSANEPVNPKVTKNLLLPSLNYTTIGDTLSDKNVSWAWYSGGYNNTLNGQPGIFQYHHQPFMYFDRFKQVNGTERMTHQKDEELFFSDIKQGTLPQVSFIKPYEDFHPGYSSLARGQRELQRLIDAVMNSDYWNKSAIIITFDENGGRWDHVPPPKQDKWGPGTRIPSMVISPFVKKGHIDSTEFQTLSVMKFLQNFFSLDQDLIPESRRNKVNDLLSVFQFPNATATSAPTSAATSATTATSDATSASASTSATTATSATSAASSAPMATSAANSTATAATSVPTRVLGSSVNATAVDESGAFSLTILFSLLFALLC